MKILHIVNVCHGNTSAPPFVKAQIESVQKTGHSVDILTINGNLSKWNYLKALVEMRQLIKQKHFDIIHAHYSYSGVVAVLQKKIPVIVSYMGTDLFGYRKADGTLKVRGVIDTWLAKILQLFVDGIIIKSKEMKKELLKKEKSIVLPNGVDFELFTEIPRDIACKKLGLDSEKKYVLFVGDRNNTRKQFYLIKEAVDLLKTEDSNIELIVAYGVAHNIIPYFMNAANVLVITSFKEGSPNVVKEAMACNLPIVATDVGDIKEVISGVHGCKIVLPDKNSIAQGISSILALAKRTEGRKAIEHLSLECIAGRLVDFYQKVLTR